MAGFTGSALTALGLSQAGLLRGPLVLGSLGGESALGEAVILAAAAATFAVAVGLLRVRRRARAASAWVGDRQIAVSDDVVVVEGNAYFPLDAVPAALLTPSRTRTVCPWKGIARYRWCAVLRGRAPGVRLSTGAACGLGAGTRGVLGPPAPGVTARAGGARRCGRGG